MEAEYDGEWAPLLGLDQLAERHLNCGKDRPVLRNARERELFNHHHLIDQVEMRQ